MQMAVGVIGLGVMGRAMADNLALAGLHVHGFDVAPDVADMVRDEVKVVDRIGELAPRSDIVLLSLPNADICRKVLAEVAESARPGTLIVDTSTVAPQHSEQLAEQAAASGLRYIAAPLIGGQPGAVAGTLTVIVGGDTASVVDADPVLRAIGELIHVVATPPEAAALKLANNMMSLGNTIVFGEAIAFARAMGIDVARVYDVVKDGSGGSAALDRRYRVNISQNDYTPGFSIALARKDLGLAVDAATESGLELPATQLALSKYSELIDTGFGDRDVSAVVLAWESVVDATVSASERVK